MEKRYQVFVSSTYEDLQPERQEVMHALLELDCIPSGMELFPAANEDQWTVIKKVIDDCDYYLVITAGKYGSIDGTGQSYTEKEYRYAMSKNKPIIAFLHKDPSSLPNKLNETDPAIKERLEQFHALCKGKVCKFWTSKAELGSVVSRSLVQLIKNNPAVGWVRGDLVPNESSAAEILRLRQKLEKMENDLARSSSNPPPGTETLAQGDDPFTLSYSYSQQVHDGHKFVTNKIEMNLLTTWNDIFGALAPMLIDEAAEGPMHGRLITYIKEKNPWLSSSAISLVTVNETSFEKIKVQLRALGLVEKSTRPHSIKDDATYWTLTPYGDAIMTKIHAIRRT